MPPLQTSATHRPATIKDVAARAGVSTATVSRVLAGKNGTRASLKRRVLRTVEELGYEPNRIARNLRARTRKVFGVVIPDLQNPFFTGIVRGMEDVLEAAGYALLIANSDDSPAREENEIRVLRAEGAAGLLLIPCRADATQYASSEASPVPIVTVDRAPPGWSVDSVKTANAAGARWATEHLLSLGHKDIGLVNGPAHYDVAQERFAGFAAAVGARGLALPAEWVAHSNFRQQGGYEATKRLLAGARRPRALFVTNDLMALGALQAIHELRLRIPQDVAIVSFDDMPWATSLDPALTTVAQPTRELGRTAAQLLLDRAADPERAVRQVVLQPELIVRASCGANSRLAGA